MTKCKKLYKIKMPLSLDEYRRGMKCVLYKMTTAEVKVIKMERKKAVNKIITETHKELDLTNRMPYIVKKVIPEAACFVEEYSINIDLLLTEEKEKIREEINEKQDNMKVEIKRASEVEKKLVRKEEKVVETEKGSGDYAEKLKGLKSKIKNIGDSTDSGHSCTTKYKNKYFDEKKFKMKIETMVNENPQYKMDGFDQVEEIDFRDFNGKKLAKVGERNYEGDFATKFDHCYVYKGVEIEVNAFGLGWISKEVNKTLRNMLVEFLQTIIETYNEWIGKSEEELDVLEEEVLNKIIAE